MFELLLTIQNLIGSIGFYNVIPIVYGSVTVWRNPKLTRLTVKWFGGSVQA